jgi:hypothetical protein
VPEIVGIVVEATATAYDWRPFLAPFESLKIAIVER